MKYLIFSLLILIQIPMPAQNQTGVPGRPDPPASQPAEQVDIQLRLAQELFEQEDYKQASEVATAVVGQAAALGLNQQMRTAQKLVIHCEQMLALQKNREKSEGVATAAIAIQQAELYFKNGEYEKAAKSAAEAYQVAAEHNDKAFMATALNKEAKAVLKKENASREEKAEARKKFRKSLKLLTENKVFDPLLKKENLEYLEELGEHIISPDEFSEVTVAVKTAVDSICTHIEKWPKDFDFQFDAHAGPEAPPAGPFAKTGSPRLEKQRELYDKILVLNRERLARELMEPLPPPATNGADMQVVVGHVTEEMKTLWPTQLKVIHGDLTENEKRISRLAPNEMREELLLATYKNRYDSLMHLRILDSINLEKQEMAIRQHEAEMERQTARRQFMMTGSGGSLLLAFFLFLGFTRQKKNNRLLYQKNEEIQREQVRSEELLLNILPAQVADELKQYGAAKARRYDNVTVLFSDFKDFTKIAENLPPEKLVKDLDYCFKAFDKIVEDFSLEKIKTIGDAYMCVGGLSSNDAHHASQTVRAAIEMQRFLNNWQVEKTQKGEPCFEARIGIHTGPVVAGVVGMKKFAYDIWGDTVNIASRMESCSEPGRINISGGTHAMLDGTFQCTYRGKVEAKNKGEIDMYFVAG